MIFRLALLVIINVIALSDIYSQSGNCVANDSSCYIPVQFQLNKIRLEKKAESVENYLSTTTPLIIDVEADCMPEIIESPFGIDMHFINPETGSVESIITTERFDANPTILAGADIDNDGEPEFLVPVESRPGIDPQFYGKIVCYELNGDIKWISDEYHENLVRGDNFDGSTGIADFDQDGIAEIYIGNRIFNAQTGILLVDGGTFGRGVNWRGSVTVAANLDDDQALELAAGYTIYKVSIPNKSGIAGNSMTPFNMEVDGKYHDGRCAVADINSDGRLDVVVHSEQFIREPYLYAYSLINNTATLIASVSPPRNTWNNGRQLHGAGTPTIGKIDNIGNVSILITREHRLMSYQYDGTTRLTESWSIPTSDQSALTGVVLFDFNGDGIHEIVYRDETDLRLLSGLTNPPTELDRYPCSSGTHNENPVVAKLREDDGSNICITCADSNDIFRGKIHVFGSPDSLGPWAPAPPVWNQYAYHKTSINDDLTVPQFMENKATLEGGRYNTFKAQRTLLDSNGMYKRRAASIYGEIDCINFDIESGEYTVDFSLFNKSDASLTVDSGMVVTFYKGDPQNGGILIGHYYTDREMFAGDSLLGLSFTFTTRNLDALFMVVNTDGADFTTIDKDDFGILECDFFDNFSQSRDLPEILDVTDSICDGQDYAFLDTIINQEGIYLRTLKDSSGCDSIVARLVLQISDSIHIIESIETCDEYTWKGTTYTESGTHSETYNVPDGCDSTVTLELIIHQSTLDTTKTTVCDSIIWNGEVYTSSGFYTFQGMTTDGCDSTLVLDLTVDLSTTETIQTTTCQSYTWKGNTYDQSGTYRFDTLNSQGCDSTLFLDLRIRDTIRTDASINICTGDTILVFNQEVFSSQVLTQDFKTPEGCDSTHTVDVVVDEVYRGMRQVSFCEGDSTYIIDRWIKEEGRVEITKTNAQDCDSIIAVQAQELTRQMTFDTVQLCEGDTLQWENEVITQTSEVSITTLGDNGCDSTSHLRAEFEQTWMSELDFELCPGDSVLINGRWVKSNKEVTQEYVAQNGCDSIIVVNIHQVATPDTPTYVLNCETRTVEVSVSAEDIWSISWDNGAQTATTNYPAGSTAEVTLTAAPNCIISYQVTLPDVPVLPSIPKLRDTSLTRGGLLNLDLALDPSIWKVTWSPSEMIDCDTCMQVRITSTQDVEIKVEYTHNSGCVIEDAFWIRYEEAGIFIPNVFSPNGDNINDRWQIYHTDNIEVERILIFDRWGELIYNSNETGLASWDGVFNGELVRPGVYTYMVSYNDGGESQKLAGDVTIVY